MTYILLFITIVLVITVLFLLYQMNDIKTKHKMKVDKLETIISTLYQQQLLLNERVSISNDYDSVYKKKLKIVSDEIVELQKVFLDVISK